MRGKVCRRDAAENRRGITPAYAGKSFPDQSSSGNARDHPRLCGEKCCYEGGDEKCMGSPPPMRGKETEPEEDERCYRITPAYAGKSRRCMGFRRCTGDHPRLCGEKFRLYNGEMLVLGSPPPMRGKVRHFAGKCGNNRITPAYAGKSSDPVIEGYFAVGSPPPMRGKVQLFHQVPP